MLDILVSVHHAISLLFQSCRAIGQLFSTIVLEAAAALLFPMHVVPLLWFWPMPELFFVVSWDCCPLLSMLLFFCQCIFCIYHRSFAMLVFLLLAMNYILYPMLYIGFLIFDLRWLCVCRPLFLVVSPLAAVSF